MKTYKLQGFVIKRQNWGEADKLLTIFSKEKGKVRFAAKGIRRIQSRRAGHLELFNQIEFLAIETKTAMDMIAETQVLQSFPSFSHNFLKTQMAYQLIELVDRLTMEEQSHEDIYDLLGRAFVYLHQADISIQQAEKVLIRFKLRILDFLGFGNPEVQTLDYLQQYIESIIERKLVARACLEI